MRSIALIAALGLAGCYVSTERSGAPSDPSAIVDGGTAIDASTVVDASTIIDASAASRGAVASSATLALRGSTLYWVDRDLGAVVSQRPGAEPVALADTAVSGGYRFIAVNDTDALWFAGTALMRVSIAGGAATQVAVDVSPLAVAADAERAYFSPLPAAGGAPEGALVELTLATSDRRVLPGRSIGVAIVDDDLVTTTCGGGVTRVPRDGAPRTSITSETFCPFTVAVDDGYVYYWDWDRSSPMYDEFAIWRVRLSGGAPALVSAADELAFAVAGPFVYAVHDGAILRARVDGSEVTELVRAAATGLAVDGDTLYWTELDERGRTALRQLALPR